MRPPTRNISRSNGESWTWAVVIARPAAPGLIREMLHLCHPETGCDGNPGGAFHRRPYIRRSRSRVLITQHGGMDI
jgi:hypothetical protein